ncbi:MULTISPECIES: serine/threonine protein kinase [Fischerella]|uniref:Serine/threonine protein kinase n=1 Tax=Fischerella muscicola CCMEE 5323 TaxID=2019572 RepID=A0A2N6K7X4_FISMU|nr:MULTISPECIES: serine/threonine-protein kinase [Fischerella]MBD2430887.1 serine/threonine protein kinase [Fischerella sp. FACHB-380]PLZ93466.1 serine/threonine protein kinase [Fischerella muscicola CCMEE 5323]
MLEAGQVLRDRYQLKQKLGQNAGRQTWLAEDLATQPAELVIVKFLAFGDQVQWDDLKLFEREADVLKQLNHPRIPKYRDYFSIDDRILWFALVQQYIPGLSLKELLNQRQKFSEEQVRKIASDVLEILIYLHSLIPHVLHRDIKPSNLILGEDQQVYLVDFGAVQDRATAQGATFTVVGTYGYAPIEQFGGRAVPASDLYALGGTLIHLVTGISPADLPQRNMRIQFSDRTNLSPHFTRWLETLTQPDVEQRFQTAHQALELLNNRLTTYSSGVVSQPHGSRIHLKKTASYLAIKIPARGIQSSDSFLLFFVSLWYGILLLFTRGIFHPFLLIHWMAGLLPLSMLLFPAFGEVYIRFDHKYFFMEWELFGQCYRRKRGNTSAIHDVCVSRETISVNNKPLMAVSIEAGVQKYKFGAFSPEITDVEQQWLVKEIKDWLGL